MSYPTVTVTTIVRNDKTFYSLTSDSNMINSVVNFGVYETADQLLAAFTWPLKAEFQTAVLNAISESKPISFNLENAFDLMAM